MFWASTPNCNCSIPAVGLYRHSTIRRRFRNCCKNRTGERGVLTPCFSQPTGGLRPPLARFVSTSYLRFDRCRFWQFLAGGWRRQLFLATLFRFLLLRLFGDFEDELEAEVLLDRTVERLFVAQPQWINGRIGCELRRWSLDGNDVGMSHRRDAEGLLQHIFACHHRRAVGSIVVVDR